MVLGLLDAILSEVVIIVGVLLVLYIIFKLGNFILGLLANVILGFISIVILNIIFNLGIPWDLWVIVITALLGLPGVAIVVILKLIGITI
jgi:inhibitor of the pro-sigma K processing machinery